MKIKVQFKGDGGDATVATFDSDNGTVKADDGRTGTFSLPEGSKTLEIKGDQDIAITFQGDLKMEAGHTVRYTAANGGGAATILSVE